MSRIAQAARTIQRNAPGDVVKNVAKKVVAKVERMTKDPRRPEAYNTDLVPLFGDRGPTETDKAVIACNDFLRMGSGRTLPALYKLYMERTSQGISTPTTGHRTIYEWSARHGWMARARSYDAHAENVTGMCIKEIEMTGLALAAERVIALKQLAERLEIEIYDDERLWLKDVRQIGQGRYAEKVELIRFNDSLVTSYRNVLDDLAKETGGRVRMVGSPTDNPLTI